MRGRWTIVGSMVAAFMLALAVGLAQAQGPQPPDGAGLQAALGTAFTYQGQLKHNGSPVNGTCDFRFTLYDAASGGTSLGTQTKTNVPVTNGLFTIPDLDFGEDAFTGDARYLEIAVRCPAGSGSYTTLSPRQALTAAPYALGLRPGAQVVGDFVGSILTLRNTAASGFTSGVYGESASTNGRGVLGLASATSGFAWGVYGLSNSSEGSGIVGWSIATSGETSGVYGLSLSTSGSGVYGVAYRCGVHGQATDLSGTTFGVWGETPSPFGRGVYGEATATSGATSGVWGESASPSGYGVYGWASATSGTNYGVYGWSASTSGTGVYGWANTLSGTTYGVYGKSASTDGRGVYGWAAATGGSTIGVYGRSDSPFGRGVYGENQSPDGRGVQGSATASTGAGIGVYGWSNSPSGYAGYFYGDVHVTGDLSVEGAKSFKIDHPLDPAGRYLYHFAQEAPEVQNVYNGVVVLDAKGEALVTLPEYFSALNTGPYRYQLTPIGAPMPNLHIAQEIQGNAFKIAGGVPGKKVSWEVTAIRNDPYVRDHPAQAEVDKPAGERGTYLYPEGHGQPREMGLDYQRNRDLFENETQPLLTGGE